MRVPSVSGFVDSIASGLSYVLRDGAEVLHEEAVLCFVLGGVLDAE